MQTDIFERIYQKYNIAKPVRLIELFGGYGSQHFSLEYLGVEFEHYKLVEWAVPSIQAYKDGHYSNDNNDYSKELTKEDLIDYLAKKQISSNYNEPMTYEQIKRKSEKWLRSVYNNIQATKNIVDITQTKASDLEIVETDKYDYIMTYSFPCQDLSLAGLGKGMSRDSGTRSGMLWQVERILDECEELPQILLMENVPEVKGTNNVQHFNEWQLKLESLGYKNYHQNLIATDYGIPQTRNRTFMISILGDYNYTFPKPIPLKLKLKDLLEENVDEKYYLSEKAIKGMLETDFQQNKYETRVQQEVCGTLCARDYKDPKCVEVLGTYQYSKSDNFMKGKDRFQRGKDTADTVLTLHPLLVVLKIPEATKKGYAEASEGDGINLKNQLCNTLIQKGMVKENEVIRHSYSNSRFKEWEKRNVEINNMSPTLDTRCDCLGVTTKEKEKLRIRKLTPRECFRLMGVKDEDFERIAKNQSDSSLYHLAGDSICITVLMAIFGQLFKVGERMKEKLFLLREDLEKAIEVRNKTAKSCFHEELMILRVNELLEVLENENKN